jgi:tetratricopeptide (TPR) repeat protein
MVDVSQRQLWQRLMRAWRKGPACQLEMGTQYTRAFPKRADGWIVLADGLAGVARYQEAKRALRRAAGLTPSERRWFIAVQWGHLHRAKGNERAAERWYRKAVALRSSTTTHVFLGATLAKQGRFADAKHHHRRAIKLARDFRKDSPDEAHYNLGLILRAERRYEESLRHLTRAIELDPKYKIAKEALADVKSAIRFREAG